MPFPRKLCPPPQVTNKLTLKRASNKYIRVLKFETFKQFLNSSPTRGFQIESHLPEVTVLLLDSFWYHLEKLVFDTTIGTIVPTVCNTKILGDLIVFAFLIQLLNECFYT